MSNIWNDADESPLTEVGSLAPDFVLKTDHGDEWRLSAHLGSVVALLFYPKSETLVCRRQLCSIRDNWSDYLASKAMIVGISAESSENQLHFSEQYQMPLPLLTDEERRITDLYARHWLFPVPLTRAVVIVDAKGIIRHREVMLRVFRPTDKSVLASIYAARTDYLYDHYRVLRESYRTNNSSENDGSMS